MPDRSRKRPTDANQLGKLIVELSTGEALEAQPERTKNTAAVALGRLGGQKGGVARAQSLTAKERQNIARRAASARWGTDKKKS